MVRFAALFFCLAAAAAGFGPDMWAQEAPARPPGVTAGQVRIGVWGPLSGPAAPWGATMRGVETYFKMVNLAGGVHGRQLKLIMFDSQYRPAIIEAGVKVLVESKGVLAFIGGYDSSAGPAVMSYLEREGVPLAGLASGSTVWTTPPRRNVFTVRPTDTDEAAALVKYAVEVLNRSRVVIVYQSDANGLDGLTGVQKQLQTYGREPVDMIPVLRDETDMTTPARRLKASNPETVILWVHPSHAVGLRKAVHRLSGSSPLDAAWMTGSALSDAPYMNKLTGGLWRGAIFTSFAEMPHADTPLMNRYRAVFRKYSARGERWGFFHYLGFGLAEPLVQALKQCGPAVSGSRLTAQLEKLHGFKGILGPIDFSPGNRLGQRGMYLAQALDRERIQQLTGRFIMETPSPKTAPKTGEEKAAP